MTKKEFLIEALTRHNGDVDATYAELSPKVGTRKVLRWTTNASGTRVPLPEHEQLAKMRSELERYAKGMEFNHSDGSMRNYEGTDEGTDKDTTEHEAEHDPIRDAEQRKAKAEQNLQEANEADVQAGRDRTEAEQAAEDARQASEDALDMLVEARQSEDTDLEAQAQQEYADKLAEYEKAKEEFEAKEQAAEEAKEKMEEAIEEAQNAEREYSEAKEQETPNEISRFIREVRRLQAFVAERDNFDALDSMRIEEQGMAAIWEGAPADALLYALTCTWGDETREQAGIPEFDFGAIEGAPDGAHAVAPYVLALMRARIPVLLYGPAGTGKSSAMRYAAEAMGLPYYEVNLAGSLPSAIKGKDRLNGFVESEFCKAYANGGVMCIEEIDAAPPQTVIAMNNAIANGHFHNDASGEVLIKHDDFCLGATANTPLTGATREFTRNKQDGAVIDRFRLGRVQVNRDPRLVDYMIQKFAADKGIEITV